MASDPSPAVVDLDAEIARLRSLAYEAESVSREAERRFWSVRGALDFATGLKANLQRPIAAPGPAKPPASEKPSEKP